MLKVALHCCKLSLQPADVCLLLHHSLLQNLVALHLGILVSSIIAGHCCFNCMCLQDRTKLCLSKLMVQRLMFMVQLVDVAKQGCAHTRCCSNLAEEPYTTACACCHLSEQGCDLSDLPHDQPHAYCSFLHAMCSPDIYSCECPEGLLV